MIIPTQVHSYDGLGTEPVPADLAGWIRMNPNLIQRGEREVTVGGQILAQLEVGANQGSSFPLLEASDGTFEVEYNDRIRFYVVDAPLGQLLIVAHASPTTVFDRFIPAVDPIVASIKFVPTAAP